MDNIDMDDERNVSLNKNFMVNAIITMSLSSNHMSLGNIDNVKYMYKNMTIDEVKEDYKKLHNLNVDILDGVAIMADTDQSKKRSISYFQSIYFSAN